MRHWSQALQAPSAAGAKRRRRQAPQAPSAAGAKCRRRQAPSAKRRRRQVSQAPSAAGAKRRRRAAAWLPTGSSWPKRSEGHERSTAGVYICVRSPGGGRRPLSVCVCVCVCARVCVCYTHTHTHTHTHTLNGRLPPPGDRTHMYTPAGERS